MDPKATNPAEAQEQGEWELLDVDAEMADVDLARPQIAWFCSGDGCFD